MDQSRTQSMPVRRLGAGHDSGETEYRICACSCSNRNTEFARASLVSIRNKIVEFVENLTLFYIEIN
jgi:hypothetical protein